MKLIPLSNNVAVLMDEPDKVTKGGIHLPDNAKDRPQRGKVMAVGRGRFDNNGRLIAVAVRVGEYVYLTPHATLTTIEIDNQKLKIVNEDDILAKDE